MSTGEGVVYNTATEVGPHKPPCSSEHIRVESEEGNKGNVERRLVVDIWGNCAGETKSQREVSLGKKEVKKQNKGYNSESFNFYFYFLHPRRRGKMCRYKARRSGWVL